MKNRFTVTLIAALFPVMMFGCGKKPVPLPPKPQDPSIAVTKAIESFLQEKSYGAKIENIIAVKVDGGNAFAAAKLAELKNTWEFSLTKGQNNEWNVVAYEIKK